MNEKGRLNKRRNVKKELIESVCTLVLFPLVLLYLIVNHTAVGLVVAVVVVVVAIVAYIIKLGLARARSEDEV